MSEYIIETETNKKRLQTHALLLCFHYSRLSFQQVKQFLVSHAHLPLSTYPRVFLRQKEAASTMAAPQPSYTKVTHSATYAAINPTLPTLSSADRVVVITGATGGIGRAAALSFAASGPKALVLLGRREDALAETAGLVRASRDSLTVETHVVDLVDSGKLRRVFADVAARHGAVDAVIHAAGVLAPVVPLVDADPAKFLDGYKTTVVGTLALAQALVLGNGEKKETTLVNLTTAGILFPPFPGMGAYVSSKMAAVKLLQAFGAENPYVRIHHVHPGFLDTAMSTQLSKTTKLPFSFDDSKPYSS